MYTHITDKINLQVLTKLIILLTNKCQLYHTNDSFIIHMHIGMFLRGRIGTCIVNIDRVGEFNFFFDFRDSRLSTAREYEIFPFE